MTSPAVPLENLAQRIAQQQSELESLRREYEARQTRLSDLAQRKQQLESQLQQIEGEIQAVSRGTKPSISPAPGKVSPAQAATPISSAPSRPLPTWPELIVEIVGNAPGPVTIKKLAEEVKGRNFPTRSKNIARLLVTRVQELIALGVLKRAQGQPGVVLSPSKGEGKTPTIKTGQDKRGKQKRSKPSKLGSPSGLVGPKKRPLRLILTDLLAKSPRPLAARELARQAKALGYRTKSGDFTNVVWVMLGKMDQVENVSGQGYRLKKR